METPRCANQQGAALKTKTQAASEPTHDGVVLTPRMGRNKKEAKVRKTNNLKKVHHRNVFFCKEYLVIGRISRFPFWEYDAVG